MGRWALGCGVVCDALDAHILNETQRRICASREACIHCAMLMLAAAYSLLRRSSMQVIYIVPSFCARHTRRASNVINSHFQIAKRGRGAMPVDSLFEVAPRWWVRTYAGLTLCTSLFSLTIRLRCVVCSGDIHAPIKDGRDRTGLDRRHQ